LYEVIVLLDVEVLLDSAVFLEVLKVVIVDFEVPVALVSIVLFEVEVFLVSIVDLVVL
tara:strand:+ start:349 stop:522 length:174 start_codon:yes stop_codon:yes gene_type:complete